jgi:hypothetical protein
MLEKVTAGGFACFFPSFFFFFTFYIKLKKKRENNEEIKMGEIGFLLAEYVYKDSNFI